MTTDPVVLPDNQRPRAPSAGASQSSTLDREVWVRRHDRREVELIAGLPDKGHVVLERHVCIDTTASGGNAQLLAQVSEG